MTFWNAFSFSGSNLILPPSKPLNLQVPLGPFKKCSLARPLILCSLRLYHFIHSTYFFPTTPPLSQWLSFEVENSMRPCHFPQLFHPQSSVAYLRKTVNCFFMAAINWSSGCRDNPLSTPYFLLFLPLFVHLMTLFGIWAIAANCFCL